MSVRVICYSGATYAECPRAVEVDGLLVEIEEVISRWRTPEGLFFSRPHQARASSYCCVCRGEGRMDHRLF